MDLESPEDIMREIRAAEEATEKYLYDLDERLQLFAGPSTKIPGLRSIVGGARGDLMSGHTANAITLMLPKSVMRAPVTRVTSRRGDEFQPLAEAAGAALTSLSRENRDEDLFERAWMDYWFAYAVYKTGVDEDERGRTVIETELLDPYTWFFDPNAHFVGPKTWQGERIVEPKDELLKRVRAELEEDPEAGWDIAAIEGMPTRQSKRDGVPNRDEVEYYELWVPNQRVDEDADPDRYHGVLVTVAKSGGDKGGAFIRDTIDYSGPKTGPYQFVRCWPFPRSGFGVSPQQMTADDERTLDKHLSAAGKAMREYKRAIIVPKTMAKKYKNLPDAYVIAVENMGPDVQPITVELGGLTAQHYQHISMMREMIERKGGLSAAQLGRPQEGVTATADAIADAETDVRSGFVGDKFRSGVRMVQQARLYFLLNEPGIRVRINDEEASAIGLPAGAVFGDPLDAEEGEELVVSGPGEPEDFTSAFEAEIETHSMERTTAGLHTARVMQYADFVLNLAPQVPNLPHVDVELILRTVADTLNVPEMGGAIDVELAYQLAGVEGTDQSNQPTARFVADAAGGRSAGLKAPRVTGDNRDQGQGAPGGSPAGQLTGV